MLKNIEGKKIFQYVDVYRKRLLYTNKRGSNINNVDITPLLSKTRILLLILNQKIIHL